MIEHGCAVQLHEEARVTATSMQAASTSTSVLTQRTFRVDVQGLRAVAVTAVLVYHLWPNRLPGGFIGVDVFFVVSGYLITGHLVRELRRSGRIRLTPFWARRAKRLLPAASLVLLVSTVATLVWVPLSLRAQFLWEHLAASLNVENWLLAWNSVDYLAARNTVSPVQHFWTLSVEEQFYVLVPLLILAAVHIARSRRIPPTRVLFIIFAIIVLGGLAYSVALTLTSPSVAYFSTATRAWEFAAGALLSFGAFSPGRITRSVLAFAGVALLGAALLLLSATTPFPGVAALLPVLATIALIAAGPHSMFAAASSVPGVGFLGRISYSLYLWHWPLIVLLPYIIGREIGTVAKFAIIGVAVLLAWATVRLIEEPVRFSPTLLGGHRRPLTVALWSMVVVAAVAVLAGGGAVASTSAVADAAQRAAGIDPSTTSCFGAAAMDPALAPCTNPDLDGVLLPDPSAAGTDDDNRTECWSTVGVAALATCSVGPQSGYAKRVFAVGDSHNNALLTAYERVAALNNWRIDVAGHNGCYWTARVQDDPVQDYEDACTAWKANVTAFLDEQAPYDAIFATYSTNSWPVIPLADETVDSATVAGLTSVWSEQAARGTKILGIRDNPGAREDVVQCVEQHRTGANSFCAQPRSAAQGRFDGITPAVAATPGAALIDLSDLSCTADDCLVIVGNAVVYRDQDHLTSTFASTLAPYLAARAAAALDDRSPP